MSLKNITMKKNFKLISGLLALAVLAGLNLSHTMNNYGIVENNLHWKVLGQTLTADGTNSGEGNGSNDSPEKKCPPHECVAGGCGASSCTVEAGYLGNTEKISVEASGGYFACCYKTSWGNWFAQTFKMADCCD